MSSDHRKLMGVLNKMVTHEKWRKVPKRKGVLVQKSKTKSGNYRLKIKGKNEFLAYVLQRNKNLYATAEALMKGDTVSVAVRRQLGKLYCVKISLV
jgi:hypothetical protein